MIEWNNVSVKLGELIPWQRNPKTISKNHATRLLALWDKLGQFQSIAIGPHNEVYDGHQRLSVLMAAHGKDYEVDARQSSRELTEKEREELVVAAHVGTVGQFDWEQLSGWDAPELIAWGLDDTALKDWKQDVSALSALLESEKQEVDAEPQLDRAAELNEKWQVKTGDLWQIGEHRLLCGDSTIKADVERVMGEYSIGAIVTDPPYGLGKDKSFNNDHEDYEDEAPFDLTLLDLSAPFVVWGGNYYDQLPIARNKIGWIVWDKRPNLEGDKRERADRRFGQHFEIAITTIGGLRGKMLRHTWGGYYGDEEIVHKTQKPARLFEDCIKETDGIILDYFAGSGTSLVACENLHRKCRAIEISPNYCAVILERMATAFPELEIVRIE